MNARILGLALLMATHPASAADVDWTFTEIQAVEVFFQDDFTITYGDYRTTIRGIDTSGVMRTFTLVTPFELTGSELPEAGNEARRAAIQRSMNKCDQSARKVQVKPDRFNLRLQGFGGVVLGGDLFELGLVGDPSPPTEPQQTFICTLLTVP